MQVELSHIISVGIVLAGYVIYSLIAWGRLSANVATLREDVHSLKESQGSAVNASDLTAAVSEMKAELYKALAERRVNVDRRDQQR